tara:strand:- start:3292 stop:3939 length:648 start_codon:yes stop_codon:yes gene_type:complete
MSWNWLRDGVGGAADFVTGGLTDFDQKGAGGYNWIPGTFGKQFNPIGGGANQSWGGGSSDGFSFGDAMDAFTKGYASTMGGGGSTPGGSSFLNAYTSGKGATPTSSSPVSTSSVFTGGGKTHTMPGIIIDEPVDFYAFRDNVQYPTQGASGSAKGPSTGDKIKSGIIDVGKAFLTKAILACDIRVKEDIAPLITTEVNDDLAQAAFFVKELRECS